MGLTIVTRDENGKRVIVSFTRDWRHVFTGDPEPNPGTLVDQVSDALEVLKALEDPNNSWPIDPDKP